MHAFFSSLIFSAILFLSLATYPALADAQVTSTIDTVQTLSSENTISPENTVAEKIELAIPDIPDKIEIIYSEDSNAMLQSIAALEKQLGRKLRDGDADYQTHKQDLLEQEILLIELNDKEFDRSGILPIAEKGFDWKENITTILQPLFSALNDLTKKPRETAKQQAQLEYMSKRIHSFNHGITVLEQLKEREDNKPSELKTLNDVQGYWQKKLEEAEKNQQHLTEILAALDREKPLSVQVNASIANALGKKIITLGWAFLTAGIVYVFLSWLASIFTRLEKCARNKRSKLLNRIGFFFTRILASVSAVYVIFIVIYLRADWVLLGLGLIVICIILISLKDSLPKYLTEIRTMLNLGSVKEGERIVFNGIAWNVNTLGMYCHLHNPALDAHFHVALSQLADCNSRPYSSNEAFFPTQVGDWVKLSDGTFGYVTLQSPENVVLTSWKNVITYATKDFIAMRPRNLSLQKNSVTTVFGIDYRYQPTITTECMPQLKEFLNNEAKPDVFAHTIETISVSFKQANTSSLDFLVICVVTGDGAEFLPKIKRWLQESCVNAANHYNWVIPFQQISVNNKS